MADGTVALEDHWAISPKIKSTQIISQSDIFFFTQISQNCMCIPISTGVASTKLGSNQGAFQ